MRWNQRTELNLAGVTYDAHRDDGLRLEIPDTGIIVRIPNNKLHPSDEGRGLGQRILNLHDRLDSAQTERHDQAERARRQIDAERARPVPELFPRHDELAETRQRRDRLRIDLMPAPETTSAQDEPSGQTSETPTPAAPESGHPVFGHRDPPTAERFAWAGAYERHDTTAGVHWGNRARGVDAWTEAVNAYSRDPRNWHATRRHDLGRFHGISLEGRIDDTSVRIEPRHPYAKNGNYPTYVAEPGCIDPHQLASWLQAQRVIAADERKTARRRDGIERSSAHNSVQHPRFAR